MSSLRIRTTFGFLRVAMGCRWLCEALAGRAVEQVRVFRREGDEDRLAFAQQRRAVGLQLDEALVEDEVDDRAVAEVLDAFDPCAQAPVGEAQVVRTDAEDDVARGLRDGADRDRRAAD